MTYLVNSSFSPILPTLQITWDSTSLKAFNRCGQYYKYTIIDGYVPRHLAADLAFGLIYHASLERYDHWRLDGRTHDDCVQSAVLYALSETWDHTLHRPRDIPWTSEKNRLTLIRTIVWYLDQFGQNDPLQTITLSNGKPAIELSFKFSTDHVAPTGETYSLAGHFDKLATFQNQIVVVDRKTSKYALDSSFFAKFSPDTQFSLYMFAAQIVYSIRPSAILVDGAQIAVTFSRFLRGEVSRSPSILDEWYEDTKSTLDLAAHYAQTNHWPKNPESCGAYRGCPFRGVCSMAPALRQTYLDADFDRRVWDPSISRGDI